MPNHVINILSFDGDKTKIRQMLEDIKPEDSSLADITINVVRPKDDPHDDTPGVVGDVVIMPGIKAGERGGKLQKFLH